MATKAELEVEVEKLNAELLSLREKTVDQSPLVKQLQDELASKDSTLEVVQNINSELEDQVASMAAEIQNLMGQLAKNKAKTEIVDSSNRVYLDGKVYEVLWRSTVKDMVYEGYHKRHLDENHTAVVIAKIGG